VHPIVRYMILCQNWTTDPENPRSINVFGLLSTIRSVETPPYPLVIPGMCVVLVLTEGRGAGTGQVRCVFEEFDETVFVTPVHPVQFGPDPLDVVGVAFRVGRCRFPRPGLYSIQFWYNGRKLEDRPLRLR
jgi:hypothetical protein